MNYWLIFAFPLIASSAFFKIGLPPTLSWVVVLPIVLTYFFCAIPLLMVFILLKTEIHINESKVIRKRFSMEKTILWEDVASIKRKNMYSIFLDKPRDFIIREKDSNQINIYGFIKDTERLEDDIIRYSKLEIKNTEK